MLALAGAACSLDRTPGKDAGRRSQLANPSGGAGSGATAGSGNQAAGTGAAGSAAVGGSTGGASAAGGASADAAATGADAAATGADAATEGGVDGCGGCDDRVFCNGSESCKPTDPAADARGCVVTAACAGSGNCDEATRSCSGKCVPTLGSIEICDGIDNDCNGKVDDRSAQIGCLHANTVGNCVQGHCVVTLCINGYADCDKLEADGCEKKLDTTPGDCHTNDCTGASIVDTKDTPIDDGNDCTLESCNAGTPVVTNANDGTSCKIGGSSSNPGTCTKGVCM